MMSILSDLCPRGMFHSFDEYEKFIRCINLYLKDGKIKQIYPETRTQWDLQADFYFDPSTNEYFKLHHPEMPSHGRWMNVSEEYLKQKE